MQIKKAGAVNEIGQKIINKVNNFPNGAKLPENTILKIESNGKQYGLIINKSDMNNWYIEIKDKISNASEWNKAKDEQSHMVCYFDKNGIMTNGTLLKNRNKYYTYKHEYTFRQPLTRKIYTDSMVFVPAKGKDHIWNRSEISKGMKYDTCNFKETVNNDFAELFFELCEYKTSILK